MTTTTTDKEFGDTQIGQTAKMLVIEAWRKLDIETQEHIAATLVMFCEMGMTQVVKFSHEDVGKFMDEKTIRFLLNFSKAINQASKAQLEQFMENHEAND